MRNQIGIPRSSHVCTRSLQLVSHTYLDSAHITLTVTTPTMYNKEIIIIQTIQIFLGTISKPNGGLLQRNTNSSPHQECEVNCIHSLLCLIKLFNHGMCSVPFVEFSQQKNTSLQSFPKQDSAGYFLCHYPLASFSIALANYLPLQRHKNATNSTSCAIVEISKWRSKSPVCSSFLVSKYKFEPCLSASSTEL